MLRANPIQGPATLPAVLKAGGNDTIRSTSLTGFTLYERHFVMVWLEDGKVRPSRPKPNSKSSTRPSFNASRIERSQRAYWRPAPLNALISIRTAITAFRPAKS